MPWFSFGNFSFSNVFILGSRGDFVVLAIKGSMGLLVFWFAFRMIPLGMEMNMFCTTALFFLIHTNCRDRVVHGWFCWVLFYFITLENGYFVHGCRVCEFYSISFKYLFFQWVVSVCLCWLWAVYGVFFPLDLKLVLSMGLCWRMIMWLMCVKY